MPDARSARRRMLDGQLSWASSYTDVPAAGYCVVGQVLYRNGEAVASVHTVTFDRDAVGHWVEYTAWPGSVFEKLAAGMPEPCRCSTDDEADGYGVVCAEHAPYPTAEVWAAARVLAANDPACPIPNLDDQEDEIRSHYYCAAEEILLAAKVVRDLAAAGQEHAPGGRS